MEIDSYSLPTGQDEASSASTFDFISGPCKAYLLQYSFGSQGVHRIEAPFTENQGGITSENKPGSDYSVANVSWSNIAYPATGQVMYVHNYSEALDDVSCEVGGAVPAALPLSIASPNTPNPSPTDSGQTASPSVLAPPNGFTQILSVTATQTGRSNDFKLSGAQVSVNWQGHDGVIQSFNFEAHTDDPSDIYDGSQQPEDNFDNDPTGDFFFYPTRTNVPWQLLVTLKGSAMCNLLVSEAG